MRAATTQGRTWNTLRPPTLQHHWWLMCPAIHQLLPLSCNWLSLCRLYTLLSFVTHQLLHTSKFILNCFFLTLYMYAVFSSVIHQLLNNNNCISLGVYIMLCRLPSSATSIGIFVNFIPSGTPFKYLLVKLCLPF